MTRPDGTAWRYVYNGDLGNVAGSYLMASITYPQGGTISYRYGFTTFDALLRAHTIASKSTSDGGAWSFTYSPGATNSNAHDRTTVASPAGTTVYRHWGAGTVVSGEAWRFGLLVDKTIGNVQSETYTWTPQQLTTERYVRPGAFIGRVDAVTYAPLLTQRVINRDGAQHVTNYSNFDGYGNAQTIVETGPNGGSRTRSLTYFQNTAAWVIRQPLSDTVVGVGSVLWTTDTLGNVRSETRDNVRTLYTRDTQGNIATVTNTRNAVSLYSSYLRGIAQSETHPEGVSISRTVSDAGTVLQETNGELKTTRFGYDGLNRLAAITPPRGNATSITYTATQKTATRGGLVEQTTTDGFGRLASVSVGGIVTTYRHDALGRRTFVSAAGYSHGTQTAYDILDRPVLQTNADGSTKRWSFGVGSATETNERSFSTTSAYRSYGNPDQKVLMSVTAPVAEASMSIARNGRDLVTSVNQNGVVRTFEYSPNNGYYLTAATHPEVGRTVYWRDAVGNLISKQVGSSGETIYVYDLRNRLTRVSYPAGNPSLVDKTYSRTDKLKSVADALSTRFLGYDDNDSLVSEALNLDGRLFVAAYELNANDQLQAIRYPVLNRTASLSPDVLGRPRSLTLNPSGNIATANYWPNGMLYDIAFRGGSRATYGMNIREWASSITVATSSGNQIASTLAQDLVGNTVQITDTADASYSRTYAYDAINRLVTANGPWGDGQITYQSAGNIGSYRIGGTSRAYAYDTSNRLASVSYRNQCNRDGIPLPAAVCDPIGAFAQDPVVYDNYGNMTGTVARPGATTYDNASNLRSALKSDGTIARYDYDGTGARVRVIKDGLTTYEFRSMSGLLLTELTVGWPSTSLLKEHFHIAGKRVAEQQTYFNGSAVQPSALQYLQPDLSGSPIASTTDAGALSWKENYTPFGEQSTRRGNNFNTQWFGGKSFDADIGLAYFGNRWYSPSLGRFTGMDPKEMNPADVHSFNRYAFANNNPYRYVDPDGRSPFDVAFLIYDLAQLGHAVYQGAGIGSAAFDVGLSVVGVLVPVPGAGQALKLAKIADKAVEAGRAAEVAAKGAEKTVYRLGESAESASRLGRKSAEAESKIGHHGVSVSTTKPPAGTACSSATCSSLEARGFEVRPTPTRTDPGHHTVMLPKPVTKEVARDFNDAFGR